MTSEVWGVVPPDLKQSPAAVPVNQGYSAVSASSHWFLTGHSVVHPALSHCKLEFAPVPHDSWQEKNSFLKDGWIEEFRM